MQKRWKFLEGNYNLSTLEMWAFIAQLRQMICRKCSAGIPIISFSSPKTLLIKSSWKKKQSFVLTVTNGKS